jgi:hypothetical protein
LFSSATGSPPTFFFLENKIQLQRFRRCVLHWYLYQL